MKFIVIDPSMKEFFEGYDQDDVFEYDTLFEAIDKIKRLKRQGHFDMKIKIKRVK